MRRRSAWRRYATHRLFAAGAILCSIAVLLAIFADVLAVRSPERTRISATFQPPSDTYLMGTDNLGRDVWSRVAHGSRVSILIGLATVMLAGIAGTLVGLFAGYYRRLDEPLMRLMDALMSFPALLLAVGITAALGPSATNVVIAIAVVYAPRTARIVRASTLVLREMDFVMGAKAAGATDLRILLRHLLPNCLGPLVVQLTFVFAYAVLAEAALSFLGMGPPPPAPSWGNVISDGRDYLREAPWICLFPGLAISITVLGLNLLGDGLRDLLDPRMKIQES
ncbi:MAG: ABC transporter permease [Alphaproteobacteria bacterium]|nr:ABC transporter permease [Alphaproteobacteria bacterium]